MTMEQQTSEVNDADRKTLANMMRRRSDMPYNTNTVAIYVAAVVILAIFAIASIVGVMAVRPAEDNTTIIATIVGFVTPITLTLIAMIQRENHLALNSRLDQLVIATNAVARGEGVVEGTVLERNNPTPQPQGSPIPQPVVIVESIAPVPVEVVRHHKPKLPIHEENTS